MQHGFPSLIVHQLHHFLAVNLVLLVKLTLPVLLFLVWQIFDCSCNFWWRRWVVGRGRTGVEGGWGDGGGREGGRLHNGGEKNKAWKAWRLPGAASALPDTPPHSLPNQQKGETQTSPRRSTFSTPCMLWSLSAPLQGRLLDDFDNFWEWCCTCLMGECSGGGVLARGAPTD